ncbi:unnamed protein product [Polarella glacialis]|uniref:Uncharacterized protein n=1 Tax=Polarella glacialis TaxID=89957 RepID=A0A813G7R0_POLGL|nr:unnamed protein product [Polarella glacialis]
MAKLLAVHTPVTSATEAAVVSEVAQLSSQSQSNTAQAFAKLGTLSEATTTAVAGKAARRTGGCSPQDSSSAVQAAAAPAWRQVAATETLAVSFTLGASERSTQEIANVSRDLGTLGFLHEALQNAVQIRGASAIYESEWQSLSNTR